MTTNVPQPIFGDKGFVAPLEADILAGVQADINADLGGNINSGLTTPQGQLATTETAVIGDAYATFLFFCNQVDPAFNSGRMQDGIGRIYDMQRIAGAPTVAQATCRGLNGVVIPVGALAQSATDGNLYVCTQQGTITSGSVILPFACVTNGPISCPAASLTIIYQAIFGWDSITNADDGVLGVNVETRAQFEARRAASVALNSVGILDGIQGAVYAVPNVLDCYVVENDLAIPQVIGGVDLAPNSIYIAVLGGDSLAVAEAIWSRKAPGCSYNGNTSIVVTDPSPEYLPPPPSYSVTFEIPETINFALLAVIKNNPGVPSNAQALLRGTPTNPGPIVNAFAGVDGGTRAKIGSTVFASRYYGPAMSLGSWMQIVDIQIGISGQACAFTGSISGTTLTVTAVSSGSLAVGQLIQDAGLIVAATTIVSQLGGSPGGTGTYQVSVNHNVVSEAMNATTLVNAITMDIDQAPTIAIPNIWLALT